MRFIPTFTLACLTLFGHSSAQAQSAFSLTGYVRADYATRMYGGPFWYCGNSPDDPRRDYADGNAALVLPAFGTQIRAKLSRRHFLTTGIALSQLGNNNDNASLREFQEEPIIAGRRYSILTIPIGYAYRVVNRSSGFQLSVSSGMEVLYLLRARDRWVTPSSQVFYSRPNIHLPHLNATFFASLPTDIPLTEQTCLRLEPTFRILTRDMERGRSNLFYTLGIAAGVTVDL